jgi:Rieske Fe-S protein
MSEEKSVTRRQFLGALTWAIGGLLSLGFGVPAIAYLLGPALRREEAQGWILLTATNKVELGTPTLFRARIQHQTGWIVQEQEHAIYVLTDNGRDFVAMSNICTHLGCRVRWIADREQFYCPCHNGIFDREGQVVSGPPPRPLDRFETRVEDGQLFVLGG